MARDADLENLVVSLAGRGWSRRRIAAELDISRNTARRILERVETARREGHTALPSAPVRRGSCLDGYEAQIADLLDRTPDLSAVRVLEDLRKTGFQGGYTVVKEHLRQRRPRPKAAPVQRFETEPGNQGQQDWSPYTLRFTGTGEEVVQAFSLILGFSRRHFVSFTERQDYYTLIRQHTEAFEHFEGVPEVILYDNQPTIVLRREAGRPIYQPRFLSFATHYGFRPHALQPRSPEQKGKIERPFQYIEGNLLKGRDFRDRADLNAFARHWMANTSDPHRHGTTGEPPIERFERERAHLLPLPTHPYDTAEVGYRVVDRAGFVVWELTPYAVPYEHLLDLVIVRATEREIFVYSQEVRLLARHERAARGCIEPVGAALIHPPRRPRHDSEALLARLSELGDSAAAFAVGVIKAQRTHGVHLAQVLALRERYDANDLNAALDRAVRYRAFDARIVARILEASARPRVLPDTLEQSARRRLREDIPGAEVTARPMQIYANILNNPGEPDDDP